MSSESHKTVRRAVALEVEEACKRGTCLRHDQLGLLQKRTLTGLLNAGFVLDTAFANEIKVLAQ